VFTDQAGQPLPH
jgi:hypothetical protein